MDSWVGKIHWRRDRLPTPGFLGFPGGSAGKESTCNLGDLGSIPGLGRSPGEGKGYSLQYSGLESSMDFIVHGFAKIWTQLSDFLSCIHWVDDAILLCHPLSPSSPALDFPRSRSWFFPDHEVICRNKNNNTCENFFNLIYLCITLTNFNSLLQFAYM